MNSIDHLLSKNTKIKNIEPFREEKNQKVSVNMKRINAGGVLIPIILFELLVCSLSAGFYLSIGYKAHSALILAITIEVFYMYFSSKRDFKSLAIKTILLAISVTTLSYSAYTKDLNVINNLNLIKEEISDSKERLAEVNRELASLSVEKQQIEKDMELFREYKKATKGNRVLAPRRKELKQRRVSLMEERINLGHAIKKSGRRLVKQGVISNITILSIQTLISILAFTVVQIAICIALPDILSQLQLNLEEKK